MKRLPLSLAAGAALVALLVGAAALSLVWTPYAPEAIDIAHRFLPPSAAHWLGSDAYGRDIASELLAGARVSLEVGLIAVGAGLVVGVAIGLFAALSGGWIEEALMRLADLAFAFPAVLVAIMLTSTYGPGIANAIVAVAALNAAIFAKLARATSRRVLVLDYIAAARLAGRSKFAIALEHVLPNVAGALIVQATIQFAVAILAEAALSYLGIGAQAPQASWGRMLNEAQLQLYAAPWLAVPPGLAVALSVLGLNLLGDGLRDALNPKSADARS